MSSATYPNQVSRSPRLKTSAASRMVFRFSSDIAHAVSRDGVLASPTSGAPRCGWTRRLPCPTVGYAELRLLNGDVFVVEGALDEVETKLSDAARSGQSRLAWFTEYGTDGSVGLNPAHVAVLKVSEISD